MQKTEVKNEIEENKAQEMTLDEIIEMNFQKEMERLAKEK